jgi:hypothetical protein
MIKYIEVNDDKFPVNYGMNALAMFSEMRGVSMNDTLSLDMDKMNLMDMMALLYVGLKDGSRKAGEKCKFNSIDEFLDYADDNKDIVNKVVEVFASYSKEKVEDSKKK